MYYPPAKFGDNTSSDFCFRVLTYTHTHIRTEWITSYRYECVDKSKWTENKPEAVELAEFQVSPAKQLTCCQGSHPAQRCMEEATNKQLHG